MLHLDLLGPLRVVDEDGNELTPSGQREQAGLVALALVAPTSLSVERLSAELYHDRETTDPRNAVQAMVSRLRRALGRSAGSVETTATGYRLVDVTLDVDEAEDLLQAARTSTDPVVARQALAEARLRWRGPTLEGLDGELIDGERLRLDSLLADTVEAVLSTRFEAGGDAELATDLESAVRDDPLREHRWELLMRCLYRDGRQAEALRAFQRARAVFSDRLGLDPGPALTALEQQILAQDPALDDPSASGGTTASGGATASTSTTATPTTATPAASPAGPDGGDSDDSGGPPAGARLPAGTVSILLCDVEGSVKRWESAPADTAREIEGLHQIWAAACDEHGGRVVKSTGDGILAVFSTAHDALTAAVAGTRAQEATALSTRVAVNTGSLEPVGDDYRGPVVNRCARLLDLANGGQILASGTTAELARPALEALRADGAEIVARPLGLQWLRDVAEPVAVWQVTGPGVRSSFPPLQATGPSSLPRLRGTLLGRDELTSRVVDQAGTDVLVTLLGPGGIGKTSTAIAVAWELAANRPVRFVDLARVTDPAAVTIRMAEDLLLGDGGDERHPLDRITDRLRANTDLVVIDNAEHVLDAVADALDAVLQHDIKGSFLVTSRRPLGLPDETIIGIPPLELPTADADLEATRRSPSVQLFMTQVRATRPQAEIPTGLLPVAAHICRRLDGIPLAIELAASRASLLSIDDIAARLDDQLRLLRQIQSSRERRHQSLEAVVGWSIELLTPTARELFDRLSIMSGSFGLAGVEAVLAHLGLDTVDPLETLDELQRASLLVVEPGGSRFRMLEPIRQAAQAELAARGLEEATRRAHAQWVIDLLDHAHHCRDEGRIDALRAVDLEADQVRAAVTWIADAGHADLAPAIGFPAAWWFLTRDARAGGRLLTRLLDLVDRDDDPEGWARLIAAIAIVTAAYPETDVAEAMLDAITIFDQRGLADAGLIRVGAAFTQIGGFDAERPQALLAEADRLVSSDDLWSRAIVDMATMALQALVMRLTPDLVDPAAAIARGERAAVVFRRLEEDWALGVTLGELGKIRGNLGDFDAAEAAYLESLELFDEQNYHGSHYVLSQLGRLASARGDHEQALAFHRRALDVAELDGSTGCKAMSMAGFAHAAAIRGDRDAADDYYRQALEVSDEASLAEHGQGEWRDELERLLGPKEGRR